MIEYLSKSSGFQQNGSLSGFATCHPSDLGHSGMGYGCFGFLICKIFQIYILYRGKVEKPKQRLQGICQRLENRISELNGILHWVAFRIHSHLRELSYFSKFKYISSCNSRQARPALKYLTGEKFVAILY